MRDDEEEPELNVSHIHNERGYREIRRALSRHYDVARRDPDIQIVDVDLAGDRRLILHHRVLDGVLLEDTETEPVLQHLADLWGYDVLLLEMDEAEDVVLNEHTGKPRGNLG